MSNNKAFKNTFNPKCIYIFRIHDEAHQGLLKIGDATVKTDKPLDLLTPNCSELNQAAKLRIKDYTNTAAVTFDLLYTELAVREISDRDGSKVLECFKDYSVHEVLKNSNIDRVDFQNSSAKEWYRVDLETAKAAIKAVKDGKSNLSGEQITHNYAEFYFRPEQKEAIDKTLEKFKTQNRMLWNAKMRFGKTLSALEVVRRSKFNKTIIITHRPVVDQGWYEDFNKVFFEENGKYIYGSKGTGSSLQKLLKSGKKFVYFASMQDLRGSERVNGPHKKNDDVFDLDWDFVIVDEAHEGTTTMLGDSVIKEVVKENNKYTTKFLALSGTPFNILNDFDSNIYTWDYIMEQQAKEDWNINHLEPNPYDDLPRMNIFTYDIGKLLFDGRYIELEDKAFNFREFFRVWTGDIKKDSMRLPEGIEVGDFYHEEDVLSFLNLICEASEESQYPYANEEYRNLFKHTLWMVPGVREAKALSKLMKKHPVFQLFEIVNVAGEGDEEEANEEALKKVNNAIKSAGEDGYTITLSCGKLTTGVTVREWTAALYLAGSFSTSASNYLQTIFRVQSPCNKFGKMKNECYVFDFAPDRTLKMVAEAASISTKAGGTSADDRLIMGKFLNYCPVISFEGTLMKPYDTANLLQQLKRAYAERAVKTGFDDINIYSNELLKLTDNDLSVLKDIKGIIGTSKAAHQTNEIDINNQGFTDEEYEQIKKAEKKKKKDLTEEEKRLLEEIKEKRKQKKDAISILRGISIRMPLLIYGVDISFEDDITIEELPNLVDNDSWTEFMPDGITKEKFKNLIKFYDPDIFIAAGRRIRSVAKAADELSPLERVKKIADLFSCFKNPDKETVLTPWRVVNMHMGDCLGGWNFFNETFEKTLDELRYVDKRETTKTVFNPDAKILEINSKTGLYPLYVASNIYLSKLSKYEKYEITPEVEEKLWRETIEDNVYVICKTPMAKEITRRTLVGYSKQKINAHYFEDLINQFAEKPEKVISKITKESYWGKGTGKMHFNAIVGNPPYQLMDGGNKNSSKPVYQHFVQQAKNFNPDYISMIMPSRWFIGGKGLDDFRSCMLNDNHLKELYDYPDYRDVFPSVEISGGVCYLLWEAKHEDDCKVISCSGNISNEINRPLNEFDVLVRDNNAVSIVRKVVNATREKRFLSNVVSPRKPFLLPTDYKECKEGIPCYFKQKIGFKFAKEEDVKDPLNILDKWKLLAPRAPIAGQTDFTKPVGFYYEGNTRIAKPGECCTETWLVLNSFDTKEECESFKSYILTKTVRFLLLQSVISQDVTRENYRFVPDLGSYKGTYTDEMLCEMWNITDEEYKYIDSRIHNYGNDNK